MKFFICLLFVLLFSYISFASSGFSHPLHRKLGWLSRISFSSFSSLSSQPSYPTSPSTSSNSDGSNYNEETPRDATSDSQIYYSNNNKNMNTNFNPSTGYYQNGQYIPPHPSSFSSSQLPPQQQFSNSYYPPSSPTSYPPQYSPPPVHPSTLSSTYQTSIPSNLIQPRDTILETLKNIYLKKLLPLENASKFSHFQSPTLTSSDLEAQPMVLLVGQYSVGKTSFIRKLIGTDYPGCRIGPEPTTDRFSAIMYDENSPENERYNSGNNGGKYFSNMFSSSSTASSSSSSQHLPGHALVMQSNHPFQSLSKFGNTFLSRFEGVKIHSPILRNITLIDTPGVLSGTKQKLGRDYHYLGVMEWFAERSDLILLMFDAHKLDISDELKEVMQILQPHWHKVRIVLNKVDTEDPQGLLRVYGALMWSLARVIQTPEVCRVYMGSFWENTAANPSSSSASTSTSSSTSNISSTPSPSTSLLSPSATSSKSTSDSLSPYRNLLLQEQQDLLNEMLTLPQNTLIRRINDIVKRARAVKVHAYIIHYLKKQIPYLVGKKEKQKQLIDQLENEFVACARRYNLPLGDFPSVTAYQEMLSEMRDLNGFKKLDKQLIAEIDRILANDIPVLLSQASALTVKLKQQELK